MTYWLMRRPPHYTDIQPSLVGTPYEYDKVYADHRLKAGDILYLIAAYNELYGWGYVTKCTLYQDSELGKEALKVTALRSVIRPELVTAACLKRTPPLARIFENSDLNLIELKPLQVNSFNQLIRSQGVEAPADIEDDIDPDMHLIRLLRIYEEANGSRTKLIELMEVLKEDVSSEGEAWDEADFMVSEGWIETIADNGPPLVRLTHMGVKTAQGFPRSPRALTRTAIPTQIKDKRLLKVFLCHSSSDKPAVRDLYSKLRSSANYVLPWLDEEDLLPGQPWQDEIRKAVRNSDVVIVCLSRDSINKTGYVQKEIKYALDIADEQPEGTIFLIPVGLEDCDIPERLRHLQCVDLSKDRGFERLMRSLKLRADKLNINTE